MAQELGYFKEEGLEEELQYKVDLTALLAGGTAEYARVTPVNALNAYAQGQELKMIFQNTYAFVFGIAVPKDSDITEFTADAFRGKAIGITEFAGGEVPMLRALLKRVGLDEGSDVELLPTSGTTQQPTVQALESGKIVAFAGSHIDFASIEAAGLELRDITPDDVAQLSADDCVGVRADYLEENRDEAVRFCRAMAKGTTFVIENPRAAADIGLPYAPESGSLDEVEEFIKIFVVRRSEPPPDTEYGEMSVESWMQYQELLLSGSTGSDDDPLSFDEPIDASQVVDNSLISEIWDFDQDAVRQQAKDYEIAQ